MFKQAVKSKSKLRLLIGSPSGGGKTYSSLSIASGISDKICVVDTERGSASLYADKFKFDVAELEKYSVDEFIKMIKEAEKSGYEVFIADSTTHIWDEILEDNQRLIKAKPSLNSYTVWMDGNSKYKKFVQTILTSNMHIICTVRMKTEYILQDNGKGRTVPVKVGMGMEQRSGFEYEFTAVMEGTVDNVFTVTKDRTGLLQGQVYEKPGIELGKQLKNWLDSGAEPKPAEVIPEQKQPEIKTPPRTPEKSVKEILKEAGISDDEYAEYNIAHKLNTADPKKVEAKIKANPTGAVNHIKEWKTGVITTAEKTINDAPGCSLVKVAEYCDTYNVPMIKFLTDLNLGKETLDPVLSWIDASAEISNNLPF